MSEGRVEYKRKAYGEILEWKRTLAGKTALPVEDACRDGAKDCPIMVKSAACRRHAPLDMLIHKYAKRLGAKYVLCPDDGFDEGGVAYLPFDMAHCRWGRTPC